VAGTLVMALTLGGAGPADIVDCLVDMAISSGMIFVILIGADLFNAFLALSGLPQDLARAITTSGLPPMGVIVLILLVYLVLGCLMDSLSMILHTLPIFFPAVMSLKLGLSPEHTAIWFGIIALIVVEVGLITPPVGLNVFVINKLAGDVPMAETFRGVVPFLISDFMRVAILLVFPFLTYAMLVWTGS
jgi:TRAP-type C4-dicarboxylate transport system permease large subunit